MTIISSMYFLSSNTFLGIWKRNRTKNMAQLISHLTNAVWILLTNSWKCPALSDITNPRNGLLWLWGMKECALFWIKVLGWIPIYKLLQHTKFMSFNLINGLKTGCFLHTESHAVFTEMEKHRNYCSKVCGQQDFFMFWKVSYVHQGYIYLINI